MVSFDSISWSKGQISTLPPTITSRNTNPYLKRSFDCICGFVSYPVWPEYFQKYSQWCRSAAFWNISRRWKSKNSCCRISQSTSSCYEWTFLRLHNEQKQSRVFGILLLFWPKTLMNKTSDTETRLWHSTYQNAEWNFASIELKLILEIMNKKNYLKRIKFHLPVTLKFLNNNFDKIHQN